MDLVERAKYSLEELNKKKLLVASDKTAKYIELCQAVIEAEKIISETDGAYDLGSKTLELCEDWLKKYSGNK